MVDSRSAWDSSRFDVKVGIIGSDAKAFFFPRCFKTCTLTDSLGNGLYMFVSINLRLILGCFSFDLCFAASSLCYGIGLAKSVCPISPRLGLWFWTCCTPCPWPRTRAFPTPGRKKLLPLPLVKSPSPRDFSLAFGIGSLGPTATILRKGFSIFQRKKLLFLLAWSGDPRLGGKWLDILSCLLSFLRYVRACYSHSPYF